MRLPPPRDALLLRFSDTERSPLSIRGGALVFTDPGSRQLQQQLEPLIDQKTPILIEGEQGSGKELLARYIHQRSERAGLFVAVNCSTISPTHGAAELFGHAAGITGGALSSRAGWLGSAQAGTVYLEEIADLTPELQMRLLDVLERAQITREGADQPTPIDIRLIASSSFDLARAMHARRMHPSLWARLQQGQIRLPPLRERPADILPLARYFLEWYCARLKQPCPRIHPETQRRLEQHRWPGNTRELENCLHFSLLMCDGAELLPQHLYLPDVSQ